nr:hypothetical protein [Tanacetum cinerariifolium]
QHPVTLRDSECLPDLLEREGINVTMFTDWFDLNERHPPAREALAYDMHKSKLEHQQLHSQLNPKQRVIYEEVVESIQNKKGQFYFVYGSGGIEKTFLYKTIISRLRSERKIVLAIASSGIASLFLLARRTTHSRFIIQLELLENSTCGIKQNTHLTKLMQEVELIIWDEAPTIQKYASEALDKTLRYILGYLAPKNKNKIFGGLTVLLGSDFRQILPIVAETYPTFIERQSDIAYLRERAILTLRNDDADTINAYMFDKLEGESVTYNNADEVCKASTDTLDQQHIYPIEFLNTLNFPRMPPCLKLKKRTPRHAIKECQSQPGTMQ